MWQRPSDGQPVLLISHDVVGVAMAGPGIRYSHLARVLRRYVEVVLAIPHESLADTPDDAVPTVRYVRHDWPSVESYVHNASIVICPSDIVSDFPSLTRAGALLVVDGYDPLLAEWLALSHSMELRTQHARWRGRMCELNQQYLAGDFYICASERQRDWWLGLLEANGRVNPWTYRQDPALRELVAVVPYGLPDTPPVHTRQVFKGVLPGIGKDDRVILWGGGLWPWLDPVTAVRAVARLWSTRQDVRLVFPGTVHPDPWMEQMPTHIEATRKAAEQAGVLDRAVFFADWLPYADWPNVLLESDVALALGLDTLENRFAFRSRVLEYIWAGIPIVATQGDACGDLVDRYQLGQLVDYQDVEGVAAAIGRLLETPREAWQPGFQQVRADFTWERVAEPLIQFCLHPHRAADKEALGDGVVAPFYEEERARLVRDRDYWKDLACRYEQGRFMRVMKQLGRWRQRLPRGTRQSLG